MPFTCAYNISFIRQCDDLRKQLVSFAARNPKDLEIEYNQSEPTYTTQRGSTSKTTLHIPELFPILILLRDGVAAHPNNQRPHIQGPGVLVPMNPAAESLYQKKSIL